MRGMRHPVLVAALVALVLGACTPAGTTPGASAAVEKVKITDATKGELEAVLQKHIDALQRRGLAGFQGTYDLTRQAFRRCQGEEFEIGGTSLARPARILKVEPYRDTYVRAYVDEGRLGIARRYFRRDEGRWIQTEPKNTELGGEKKKTVEGLRIEYWAIDEDSIDLLAREGLATREFLKKHAPPRQTDLSFGFRVYPTRESAGITAACRALASSGDANDPLVRFYGAWLAPSLAEVSVDMRDTYQHEGLHNLQEQFYPGIFARLANQSWWLIEGWPDHVAGPGKRVAGLRGVLCGDQGFTFKQLSDGPPFDDPVKPPGLTGQYYAYAASMVDYLLATYGTDTYWALVAAHVETVDAKIIYPKVVKKTGEEFFAEWQAWAKKKYC